MKVKSISHLAFKIRNLDSSLHFYCDILGLKQKFSITYGELIQRMGHKYQEENGKESIRGDQVWLTYLEITPGNFIELFPIDPSSPAGICDDDHIGYTHLSLEVDDIKDAYEKMKASGVNIISEISYSIDFTYQFWITDPDGNRIEMMQYTDKSFQIVGNQQ